MKKKSKKLGRPKGSKNKKKKIGIDYVSDATIVFEAIQILARLFK